MTGKKTFYGQQISHLYNQIENRPPPNTHYVRKQQLSLACWLAFVIFQQVFHSDSGPAMVLINNTCWIKSHLIFSPQLSRSVSSEGMKWDFQRVTLLRWKVTSSHNIKYKYGRKNMCNCANGFPVPIFWGCLKMWYIQYIHVYHQIAISRVIMGIM